MTEVINLPSTGGYGYVTGGGFESIYLIEQLPAGKLTLNIDFTDEQNYDVYIDDSTGHSYSYMEYYGGLVTAVSVEGNVQIRIHCPLGNGRWQFGWGSSALDSSGQFSTYLPPIDPRTFEWWLGEAAQAGLPAGGGGPDGTGGLYPGVWIGSSWFSGGSWAGENVIAFGPGVTIHQGMYNGEPEVYQYPQDGGLIHGVAPLNTGGEQAALDGLITKIGPMEWVGPHGPGWWQAHNIGGLFGYSSRDLDFRVGALASEQKLLSRDDLFDQYGYRLPDEPDNPNKYAMQGTQDGPAFMVAMPVRVVVVEGPAYDDDYFYNPWGVPVEWGVDSQGYGIGLGMDGLGLRWMPPVFGTGEDMLEFYMLGDTWWGRGNTLADYSFSGNLGNWGVPNFAPSYDWQEQDISPWEIGNHYDDQLLVGGGGTSLLWEPGGADGGWGWLYDNVPKHTVKKYGYDANGTYGVVDREVQYFLYGLTTSNIRSGHIPLSPTEEGVSTTMTYYGGFSVFQLVQYWYIPGLTLYHGPQSTPGIGDQTPVIEGPGPWHPPHAGPPAGLKIWDGSGGWKGVGWNHQKNSDGNFLKGRLKIATEDSWDGEHAGQKSPDGESHPLLVGDMDMNGSFWARTGFYDYVAGASPTTASDAPSDTGDDITGAGFPGDGNTGSTGPTDTFTGGNDGSTGSSGSGGPTWDVSGYYDANGNWIGPTTPGNDGSISGTDPTGCSTGGVGALVPTAAFTVNAVGREVTVDASGSKDPVTSIVRWDWGWGDGTSTTATSVRSTKTYANDGNFTIKLVISDAFGASATVSRTIAVSSQVTDPGSGSTVTPPPEIPGPTTTAAGTFTSGDMHQGIPTGVRVYTFSQLGLSTATTNLQTIVDKLPGAGIIQLPGGGWSGYIPNFSHHGSNFGIQNANLHGLLGDISGGRLQTQIRMAPHSMTSAQLSTIQHFVRNSGTTQIASYRNANTSPHYLAGINFVGADQQRMTNYTGTGPATHGGLYLNNSGQGSMVQNCLLQGFGRGDDSTPPGEVGNFSEAHTVGFIMRRVEIDGRLPSSGTDPYGMGWRRGGGVQWNAARGFLNEDVYHHDTWVSGWTASFTGTPTASSKESNNYITRNLRCEHNSGHGRSATGQNSGAFRPINMEFNSGTIHHYNPTLNSDAWSGGDHAHIKIWMWNKSTNWVGDRNMQLYVHGPNWSTSNPRDNGCFSIYYAGLYSMGGKEPIVYNDAGVQLDSYVCRTGTTVPSWVTKDKYYVLKYT